jgi:hypothetical protein
LLLIKGFSTFVCPLPIQIPGTRVQLASELAHLHIHHGLASPLQQDAGAKFHILNPGYAGL